MLISILGNLNAGSLCEKGKLNPSKMFAKFDVHIEFGVDNGQMSLLQGG